MYHHLHYCIRVKHHYVIIILPVRFWLISCLGDEKKGKFHQNGPIKVKITLIIIKKVTRTFRPSCKSDQNPRQMFKPGGLSIKVRVSTGQTTKKKNLNIIKSVRALSPPPPPSPHQMNVLLAYVCKEIPLFNICNIFELQESWTFANFIMLRRSVQFTFIKFKSARRYVLCICTCNNMHMYMYMCYIQMLHIQNTYIQLIYIMLLPFAAPKPSWQAVLPSLNWEWQLGEGGRRSWQLRGYRLASLDHY